MDTQARKDKLIKYIQNLSDPKLLERFEAMIDQRDDWADRLSPNERNGILEAQEQVRYGNTLDSDQVWKKFDQQFSE